MLKIAFIILVFIHGLIHLMGFSKAFALADIAELSLPISKTYGVIWLLAFLLLLFTGFSYILKINFWWSFGLLAVFVSQILVISFWQDAKFGTIANIIILLVSIQGYGNWSFENSFRKDVKNGLDRTIRLEDEFITKNDLQHLPLCVQNYLNYVGVVGKPKVKNVRIVFEGEMRSRSQAWFSFTAEQYNFFDQPERLFFMKAKVKGLPTSGYHAYQQGNASMQIKLLSLFPVVSEKGDLLNETETVTFFNDLCLFAPSHLIDKNIQWEEMDKTTVKAQFKTNAYQISAILFFNEEGQLIDFRSDDRSDISDRKKYTFSTPVKHYEHFHGYKLCSYGEAVWHYPEGAFTYGKFKIKSVEYNVNE